MSNTAKAVADLQAIDFHDSEIVGFQQTDDELVLRLKDWREKMLFLKFSGVIRTSTFLPVGCPEVSVRTASDGIDDAVRNVVQCYGQDSEYAQRQFAEIEFLDEGLPFTVVFNAVSIEWQD